MYLLDTNVVSELRRGPRGAPSVRDWVAAQLPASLFISAITLLELERGVLLKARKDPIQGERLSAWLRQQVMPTFEGRTLAITAEVALRTAALHVPNPASERDAMIAATAIVHGFTLVTRNLKDFELTGVKLIDPWGERP